MRWTPEVHCGNCFFDMHKSRTLIFVVCTSLVASVQQAAAQVERGTLWRDAVVTKLDVDFPGTGFHGGWIYHRCPCGDLLLEVEQVAPDSVLNGDLLIVDGKVLLARGFKQQGPDLVSLVQAPTLMLQLALALLNRSQPRGPAAVTDKQQWDSGEAKLGFTVDNGLTSGNFAAPWGVSGSGWKAAAGRYRFELGFHFTNPVPGDPGARDRMQFSGELDFRAREFPVAELTSLQGWNIQWLSPAEKTSKEVPEGLTLKALRQQTKKP